MPETIYVFIQACEARDYDKIKEILDREFDHITVTTALYGGYRASRVLDEMAVAIRERIR